MPCAGFEPLTLGVASSDEDHSPKTINWSCLFSDVSAIVSALAQEVDEMSSDESDTTSESQHQQQHHPVNDLS